MTDKEVQKLSRMQLVEILYLLSQENDKLREENQQLKKRLDMIVDKMVAEKAESSEPETPAAASSAAPKSRKKRK